MVATILLLVTSVTVDGRLPAGGTIDGQVVNASREGKPVPGAEVVLRMQVDGRFECVARTTADDAGYFRFEDVPLGSQFIYLPGSNRHGIHYPGSRLRLPPENRRVGTRIEVRDALTSPNPLVARSHEIVVRPERGALVITETIEVENPTSMCYVGRPEKEGREPVTLTLAISPEFSRVTFYEEFFGRRFAVGEDSLVTGIPWQPGTRELKFTYVLANEHGHLTWKRPLDLECRHVRLCVHGLDSDRVACNLARLATENEGEAVFDSGGQVLPAGHLIHLQLRALPIPWAAYGRWLAVAVLFGLVAFAGTVTVRDRRRLSRCEETGSKAKCG